MDSLSSYVSSYEPGHALSGTFRRDEKPSKRDAGTTHIATHRMQQGGHRHSDPPVTASKKATARPGMDTAIPRYRRVRHRRSHTTVASAAGAIATSTESIHRRARR